MQEVIETITSNMSVFVALYGPAIIGVITALGSILGFIVKCRELTRKMLSKTDLDATKQEIESLKETITTQTNQINRLTEQITRVKINDEDN